MSSDQPSHHAPSLWSRRRTLWTVRLLLLPIHVAFAAALGSWGVMVMWVITCLGMAVAYDLGARR